MENNNSHYSLSLNYMLKSYSQFADSLKRYVSMPLSASSKLHGLLHIWTHPRGIQNLIGTLALQCTALNMQAHAHNASTLPQATNQTSSRSDLIPPSFEVANPLFKKEESVVKMEQGLEEQPIEEDQGDEVCSEEDYSQSPSGANYKRGPYKSYSTIQKEKAVRLLLEEQMPITEISRKLSIPCKNIKRWSTQGVDRKRGGGRRRSSPEMEEAVNRWIRQQFAAGEVVELDRIQEYALAICGDDMFKASRGWVIKFIDRFQLRNVYTFR